MDNRILSISFGTFVVSAVSAAIMDPQGFGPLFAISIVALVVTGILAVAQFINDLGKALRAFNTHEQNVNKRMDDAEKTVASMSNKINTLMGEQIRRKL